jgi:serine protease
VPLGPDDPQLSECNCTTSTCGAGIAHAGRAVVEALRPIAIVTGPQAVDAGSTVHLSGLASRGADGRTIVSHEWALVAGDTALASTMGGETSFVAPGSSSDLVVRLTVTDDLGRVDSTDVRIAVGGGAPAPVPPTSPAPPQPAGAGGGGGGGGGAAGISAALLLLVAGAARLRHRRRDLRRRRDRCEGRSPSGHGAT